MSYSEDIALRLQGRVLPDLVELPLGQVGTVTTGSSLTKLVTSSSQSRECAAGPAACRCIWENGQRVATCNAHMPTKSTTLEDRWGKPAMRNGFSAVPGLLLDNVFRLGRNGQKITPMQLAILIAVARGFRHVDQLVEIADNEIAKRMGCDRTTVVKAAQGLHDMGLIVRHVEKREDGNNLPAKYDVAPLIVRLEELSARLHP